MVRVQLVEALGRALLRALDIFVFRDTALFRDASRPKISLSHLSLCAPAAARTSRTTRPRMNAARMAVSPNPPAHSQRGNCSGMPPPRQCPRYRRVRTAPLAASRGSPQFGTQQSARISVNSRRSFRQGSAGVRAQIDLAVMTARQDQAGIGFVRRKRPDRRVRLDRQFLRLPTLAAVARALDRAGGADRPRRRSRQTRVSGSSAFCARPRQ